MDLESKANVNLDSESPPPNLVSAQIFSLKTFVFSIFSPSYFISLYPPTSYPTKIELECFC